METNVALQGPDDSPIIYVHRVKAVSSLNALFNKLFRPGPQVKIFATKPQIA